MPIVRAHIHEAPDRTAGRMSNSGHYNRKHIERTKPTHPAKARRLARGAAKLAAKAQRTTTTMRWF